MNKILLVIRIWFFPSLDITGSACKGISIFKKFYLPNKRSVLILINSSFIETFIQIFVTSLTHFAIKSFWKSKSITACCFWKWIWFVDLLFFFVLLLGIFKVSEFMQDLQCLATNVLNQFHFWVDLYESLMQNKVQKLQGVPVQIANLFIIQPVHRVRIIPTSISREKKTWNANVVCFYWKILNGNPEKLIITVKRVLYSSYNMNIGLKSFFNFNFRFLEFLYI